MNKHEYKSIVGTNSANSLDVDNNRRKYDSQHVINKINSLTLCLVVLVLSSLAKEEMQVGEGEGLRVVVG